MDIWENLRYTRACLKKGFLQDMRYNLREILPV